MTLTRIVSEILWWWRVRHNPLSRTPGWRKAHAAEMAARRRGCTQAIGKARKDMRQAVLDDLRRAG